MLENSARPVNAQIDTLLKLRPQLALMPHHPQAFDMAPEQRMFRSPGDDHMELHITLFGFKPGPVLTDHHLNRIFHTIALLFASIHGSKACSFRLQQQTHLNLLEGSGFGAESLGGKFFTEVKNNRADISPYGQDPGNFQSDDGLAYRRTANPQNLRQFRLGRQAIPFAKVTGDKILSNIMRNPDIETLCRFLSSCFI